ncbi:hypothetical protein CDE51_04505 [Pasteurella multocida]|nr:hypothetical protein CDE51_04505 [Pasteurella multocida]
MIMLTSNNAKTNNVMCQCSKKCSGSQSNEHALNTVTTDIDKRAFFIPSTLVCEKNEIIIYKAERE